MSKPRNSYAILLVIGMLFSCKADKNNQLTLVTEKDKVHDYVGKKLPDWKFQTLENKEVKLTDFLGKPVVLNLWFVACAPCIVEMPILNTIKAKYEEDVHFLSMTFDTKDKVDKLLEKRQFNFMHLVDAKEFLQNIGVKGYPKSIFIDEEGVVQRIEGSIPFVQVDGKLRPGDGKEFYEYIDELLADAKAID